ncbi:hypothetical protein YC2023_061502 [Brassica napus]
MEEAPRALKTPRLIAEKGSAANRLHSSGSRYVYYTRILPNFKNFCKSSHIGKRQSKVRLNASNKSRRS